MDDYLNGERSLMAKLKKKTIKISLGKSKSLYMYSS